MMEGANKVPAKVVGFGDIKSEPIKGWEEFLKEGQQFLGTAERAYAMKRESFTAEILYNLVAMAIEKLIMGLLMKSGNLPYNHTMHDLVEAMEESLPGRLGTLGERLKGLDAFQEICDTESYTIIPPTMGQIAEMISLAGEIRSLALTGE